MRALSSVGSATPTSGRVSATALNTSQAHDEYDVPPITLSDKAQRLCEAVLCERCQIGDPKRMRGHARSQILAEFVCPHGCTAQDGSPSPFTWRHVQFFCGHERLVAARREWRATIDAADAVASDELPHSQLLTLRRLVEEGVPQTRGGAVARDRALTTAVELTVRRATGGLVRRTGQGRGR